MQSEQITTTKPLLVVEENEEDVLPTSVEQSLLVSGVGNSIKEILTCQQNDKKIETLLLLMSQASGYAPMVPVA